MRRYRGPHLYPLHCIESEPERILKLTDIKMSIDKALSLAQTSVTIQIQFPQNKEAMSRTMFMTHEKASKNGVKLINENFGVTR